MNNIRDDNPLYTSMKPFAWMLFAMSISTYAIAGLSIWRYNNHKEREHNIHRGTNNKNTRVKTDERDLPRSNKGTGFIRKNNCCLSCGGSQA